MLLHTKNCSVAWYYNTMNKQKLIKNYYLLKQKQKWTTNKIVLMVRRYVKSR